MRIGKAEIKRSFVYFTSSQIERVYYQVVVALLMTCLCEQIKVKYNLLLCGTSSTDQVDLLVINKDVTAS